ncbi:MAG: tyrosine-type recombinase/integrase [Candidatus Microthrix sp.]|nr:tyrosine-type recombinase/integrase [Candidatus Microthrix sp.]MBK7020144.1 tyrosine-type recombinase/integrase [Candidatus Microthrix sp.]
MPPGRRRITPYLFTEADLDALLEAAGQLTAGLRADTYQTLIGLLSVSGMRVGETAGLDRADIDWDHALLTIRNTKFGKSRQIPLHPTTMTALEGYARRRMFCWPRGRSQQGRASSCQHRHPSDPGPGRRQHRVPHP